MTAIERLNGSSPVGGASALATDARALAGAAISEIGARAQAWSQAITGTGASGATGFRPDAGELARGGDVYGLRQLAGDIAGRIGATPTEEGALVRALEDLTRQVAVQVHGLAGAGEDRQLAGTRAAIDDALAFDAPEGVDGVIARLEAATERLAAQHG